MDALRTPDERFAALPDFPYEPHYTDIADPGTPMNIHNFFLAYRSALTDVLDREKLPVVCGGSGLYIETALGRFFCRERSWPPILVNGNEGEDPFSHLFALPNAVA